MPFIYIGPEFKRFNPEFGALLRKRIAHLRENQNEESIQNFFAEKYINHMIIDLGFYAVHCKQHARRLSAVRMFHVQNLQNLDGPNYVS